MRPPKYALGLAAAGALLVAASVDNVLEGGELATWMLAIGIVGAGLLLAAAGSAGLGGRARFGLVASGFCVGLLGALLDLATTFAWARRTGLYEAAVVLEAAALLEGAGASVLWAARDGRPSPAIGAALRFAVLLLLASLLAGIAGDLASGAGITTWLRLAAAVALLVAWRDREAQAPTRPA